MRQWYPGPTRLTCTFNWNSKLRKAEWPGNNSIELKYDPLGNRVYKKSTASGSATERKYVVDITGELPVILLEIDSSDSSLKKTYIYGNSQILAQHAGDHTAVRYFYLQDRLGSVRLIMNGSGTVVKDYTYEPFGEVIESGGTLDNSFMFTGQYFDSQIEEYYLRARQYNPHIGRFTSRDPIAGKFKEPLTLHRYLYSLNDPVNRTDPSGEFTVHELGVNMLAGAVLGAISGSTLGGLGGGVVGHGGEWSWSGAARGAARGAVFGSIQGAFFSTGGYLFEVLKKSPVLMGAISGLGSGAIKGLYDQWRAGKWDMEAVFRQAAVDAVGAGYGGLCGYGGTTAGLVGSVAFGQAAENVYNYFFVEFGGWPPVGPPE